MQRVIYNDESYLRSAIWNDIVTARSQGALRMFDIKKVKEEAAKEIANEKAERAKKALVAKYRELDAAKSVVANIERAIADLEQSIIDGSFIGK